MKGMRDPDEAATKYYLHTRGSDRHAEYLYLQTCIIISLPF